MNLFGDKKPALFLPKDGSPQTIEVIFNEKHQEVDELGKPYGNENPRAWVNHNTICAEYDDRIEIEGKVYLIKDVQFNGLETDELILAREIT